MGDLKPAGDLAPRVTLPAQLPGNGGSQAGRERRDHVPSPAQCRDDARRWLIVEHLRPRTALVELILHLPRLPGQIALVFSYLFGRISNLFEGSFRHLILSSQRPRRSCALPIPYPGNRNCQTGAGRWHSRGVRRSGDGQLRVHASCVVPRKVADKLIVALSEAQRDPADGPGVDAVSGT